MQLCPLSEPGTHLWQGARYAESMYHYCVLFLMRLLNMTVSAMMQVDKHLMVCVGVETLLLSVERLTCVAKQCAEHQLGAMSLP